MKTNKLKTYLKFGILLLGSSLILINCRTDELTFEPSKQIDAKTVSFEQAKAFFKNKKGNDQFAKRTSSNELILNPDWNSLEHSDLVYTEAQLTKANTEVNRNGEYTSKLLFVNIDDQIKSVILTTWVTDYDAENNIVNATVYFNDYDGAFMDAYKIEDGMFTKRLKPKPNIQTASFFMFIQGKEAKDCWNTDNLPEGQQFNDVDLGIVSGSNSGSGSFVGANYSGVSYYDLINYSVSPGGFVTGIGGTTITLGGIDAGATRILMNPPIETDEEGTCPPGYAKDPVTDECISICNGGKVYNEVTNECECPEDLTENQDGNCVENPCPGDPVFNPEIAPQYGLSGTKGALHGCTRYGGTCTGADGRTKQHDGIDIKRSYGQPVFALFNGKVHSNYFQKNKAGYVTRIRSELPNGKIIIYQYFHLQENTRLPVGTEVNSGDIIAYLGDSGNLKSAVLAGDVDSHVHIKMNLYDGTGDSNDYTTNFKNNPVNPSDYMTTKFDSEGNKIENNCN